MCVVKFTTKHFVLDLSENKTSCSQLQAGQGGRNLAPRGARRRGLGEERQAVQAGLAGGGLLLHGTAPLTENNMGWCNRCLRKKRPPETCGKFQKFGKFCKFWIFCKFAIFENSKF